MRDQDSSWLASIAKSHRYETPEDLREPKSMNWYIDEVVENPEVARNAHQRVSDMFDYYGTEYDSDREIVEYQFALKDPIEDGTNTFYGSNVHESIHEFVDKIKGGARGLGPDRRIKLLLGPVGSGKSDFDRQVRKYYEHYTSIDAGRMYTFRWTNLCEVINDQDPADDVVRSPMNQDPLVLVPRKKRDEILEEANRSLDRPYTLRNERSPDPESTFYLDRLLQYYREDLQAVLEDHVEVIRLIADENKRECIETFEPKDKKNQDETELTGDVNYSKLAVYGESDPRAFDYSGALCNANRGIFSGEELLKLQREFLYDFLHVTQEKTIKPKNNPRIDIDEVIVGRTNMPEYRDKRGDEKMEAFNDRTKRIDFPYVLKYEAEAEIYRKILRNADADRVHVEPHTLELAGLWAVVTRLDEPDTDQISVIQKARAYNRPESEPEIDVRKLRREAKSDGDEDEGMEGVSPRFVSDEISESIMHRMHEDSTSLSALTVLDHFEDNMESHGSIPSEKFTEYNRYLEDVREEYKERAIEDVRNALAYDEEELKDQGEKYFDHVMAYIDDDTVEDPISGEDISPDETFMRSVEEQLNISEDRKDTFRQEVSNWISRRARRGDAFVPTDNDKLRRALERKLWEDKRHNINFSALVSASESDEEKRSGWIESLKELGYSENGAKEVLEFAGAAVAKAEMENS